MKALVLAVALLAGCTQPDCSESASLRVVQLLWAGAIGPETMREHFDECAPKR